MTVLSIIVLSWNTQELLRSCLDSIYQGPRAVDFEVVVVDNASKDDSTAMVKGHFPQVTLIQNQKNEGYARGNNIGILRSRGEFVLLLNSDTEVKDDALETMVDFLRSDPSYGACGAQLLNPDGSVQHACMRFPDLMVTLFFDTFLGKLFPENLAVKNYFMQDFDHKTSVDVDQPPGACFMVSRKVVEKVGLFDESLFLFFNDVDFCKRIWEAGYRIRFFSRARVMHHVGKSTRKYSDFSLEWHRNRVRYYRKHFGLRGAAAAKLSAVLKGSEEIIRCFREGCGFRSPETKKIGEILREVLRT